jgi:hypothetical protein
MERFNLEKLNEIEGKKRYPVDISNRVLENLDTEVDVNKRWESIGENIKHSVKDRLGYYELKKNKLLFDEGCSEFIISKEISQIAVVTGSKRNTWG